MSTAPELISDIKRPTGVAAGAGSVWVTSRDDGTVVCIDPVSRTITGAIPIGEQVETIALLDESLWVCSAYDAKIVRIEPFSREIVAERPLRRSGPVEVVGIAVGEGCVWITDKYNNRVERFDATTGEVVDEPIQLAMPPYKLAVGGGSVWAVMGLSGAGAVGRIDAHSGDVGNYIDFAWPTDVAVGEGYAWVTNASPCMVTRIDLVSGEVTGDVIELPDRPSAIAVGAGELWIASEAAENVTRVTATGEVVGEPIPTGWSPKALAFGEGAVWVAVEHEDTVARIEP